MAVVRTTMTSAFFYDIKKLEPLNAHGRGMQCKFSAWNVSVHTPAYSNSYAHMWK